MGSISVHIPRLLIAGAGSGSGKTTVVCGLLAELKRRGMDATGYKIGPDYIDPGYQRIAGQCLVYNLDTWIMDCERMIALFARTANNAGMALAEGVMGLYDGGRGGISSSAEIAKLLKMPVVLVLNVRSIGESAAAVALGFRDYDPSVDLRGVILNGVGSDSHRDLIAEALERVGIPLLGALRRDEELTLPERHLGLVPVEESGEAEERMERIHAAVLQQVDVNALVALARSAPPVTVSPLPEAQSVVRGLRVAVARDEAFSFYYPESLASLEELGAELVPFSPLRDASLPENVHGLILGGGFPEMFAGELEANVSMRRGIAQAVREGLPLLAECGGLMVLCRALTDWEGRRFEMAGVVPAECQMNKRLQAVGYVEATALRDTVLGPKGMRMRGHTFHFSSVTPDGDDDFPRAFRLVRQRTGETRDGYARGNVLASYLHINFFGAPHTAEYFLRRCAEGRF